ncbi:hypothetical protein ARMGADRAFT_1031932 [Armillaria gallica]|uniref:Uncharacterized protein n=1 Tax=Armillaria gallica TaxID=47427 RepID=A0A2H3DIG1_ARMGA|nr:hypothetical protein ARMGADRAFT_1031932 [Armillaria gallica]
MTDRSTTSKIWSSSRLVARSTKIRVIEGTISIDAESKPTLKAAEWHVRRSQRVYTVSRHTTRAKLRSSCDDSPPRIYLQSMIETLSPSRQVSGFWSSIGTSEDQSDSVRWRKEPGNQSRDERQFLFETEVVAKITFGTKEEKKAGCHIHLVADVWKTM